MYQNNKGIEMIDTNKIIKKLKDLSNLLSSRLLVENDVDKSMLITGQIASMNAHVAMIEILTEIRDILKKESK